MQLRYRFQPLTIFAKKLRLRCLIGLQIHVCELQVKPLEIQYQSQSFGVQILDICDLTVQTLVENQTLQAKDEIKISMSMKLISLAKENIFFHTCTDSDFFTTCWKVFIVFFLETQTSSAFPTREIFRLAQGVTNELELEKWKKWKKNYTIIKMTTSPSSLKFHITNSKTLNIIGFCVIKKIKRLKSLTKELRFQTAFYINAEKLQKMGLCYRCFFSQTMIKPKKWMI